MTDNENETNIWTGTATVEGDEIVVRWKIDPQAVVDAFAQTIGITEDDAVIAEANELGRQGLIELLAATLAAGGDYLADNGSDSVGGSAYDFIADVVRTVLTEGRYEDA